MLRLWRPVICVTCCALRLFAGCCQLVSALKVVLRVTSAAEHSVRTFTTRLLFLYFCFVQIASSGVCLLTASSSVNGTRVLRIRCYHADTLASWAARLQYVPTHHAVFTSDGITSAVAVFRRQRSSCTQLSLSARSTAHICSMRKQSSRRRETSSCTGQRAWWSSRT